MRTAKGLMLLVPSLIPTLVWAHPGHDHYHWSAGIIHSYWIWPLVAAGVFAAVFLYKKNQHKDR